MENPLDKLLQIKHEFEIHKKESKIVQDLINQIQDKKKEKI